MPNVQRTCRTPGCIQKDEPIKTGLRTCIHCGREMEAPEPTTAPSSAGYAGLVGGLAAYAGYMANDAEDDD